MLNNITNAIVALSQDPNNPELNFNAAVEYDNINQTASAVSFYLKAAEYSNNNELTYSSLIKLGLCFNKQGQRNASVLNSYFQAIQLIPNRPEAYYMLSKFYEKGGNWQESYTYAKMGIFFRNDIMSDLPCDLGYMAKEAYTLQRAISAWYIGRYQESKDLFFELAGIKNLPQEYKWCILNNFKNFGWIQDKIAVIIPVRDGGTGRSRRLLRLLQSWSETTEGLSDIHIIIDEDDVDNFEYLNKYRNNFFFYIKPAGLTLMEKINTIGLDIAHMYKYVQFVGDDVQFKTKWERTFINHLSQVPAGLVYGDSMENNGIDWANHFCLTSNLIKAVGFYGCPAVSHNFFDNYWADICKELNSFHYIPEVIMDHRREDGEKDFLYWNIVDLQDKDRPKYAKYKKKNFEKDLKKIRDSISGI